MDNYKYTIVDGKQVPLEYSIPSSIMHRFTGEFLDIFYTEMLRVFWPYGKQLEPDLFTFFIGTVGWDEAFSKTCEKLSMAEVLKYYESLEKRDSDIFDDEICRLLKRWRKRK